MSNNKTKMLLILSLILVSLLSNNLSIPFFEFEGKGIVNHDKALALQAHDPSLNNTNIQSTTSPIYKTNNSSSDICALVDKAYALYSQGNYTHAIQYYNKALAIDPNDNMRWMVRVMLFTTKVITNLPYNITIKFTIDPHYTNAIYDKDTALNRTESDVGSR